MTLYSWVGALNGLYPQTISWCVGNAQPGHSRATWLCAYLAIKVFLGPSSGDHSLNEVFRKNSDPVLDPTVSRE